MNRSILSIALLLAAGPSARAEDCYGPGGRAFGEGRFDEAARLFESAAATPACHASRAGLLVSAGEAWRRHARATDASDPWCAALRASSAALADPGDLSDGLRARLREGLEDARAHCVRDLIDGGPGGAPHHAGAEAPAEPDAGPPPEPDAGPPPEPDAGPPPEAASPIADAPSRGRPSARDGEGAPASSWWLAGLGLAVGVGLGVGIGLLAIERGPRSGDDTVNGLHFD